MTVLVTGGAGYIGSHMAHELADMGEKVIVLDNLSTGLWWAVPAAARMVKGDAGDAALLEEVLGSEPVEAIVHFAGSIVVPESVADPLAYYLNNTVKSRELIAAAVRHRVPNFIFSSTAAVYGSPRQLPVPEDAALQPESPYGRSKLMTEIMLKDSAAAYGLNYVALRYFNVAGAEAKGRVGQSTPRATHLIKAACQVALGERPQLEIFGRDWSTPDGTCIRDYIHVSDLIDAHVCALEHLRRGGGSGVYNCGYGKGYSVLEVIGAVERAHGAPLPVKDAPRRPGDAEAIVADSRRAQEVLGWQPKRADLDVIVSSALAWEKRLKARND